MTVSTQGLDGDLSERYWRVESEQLILDASPWFKVTRQALTLPDGRQVSDYYQIYSPSYVEIVAVRRDGRVQCHWRYKHGPRNFNLGLPAGYINTDEDILSAAKRELHEECGLQSEEWASLGAFTIDGNRGQAKAHMFLAWDCVPAERIPSDDLEAGEPVWLTGTELEEHLARGDVATLGVAAATLLALPLIRSRFPGQ